MRDPGRIRWHQFLCRMAIIAVLPTSGCTSDAPPGWVEVFRYSPSEVYTIKTGDFGFPYVPVAVMGSELLLPFDTGNMVGVSVSTGIFDELSLTAGETWTRANSAGKPVASLRVAYGVDVSILGRSPVRVPVYEHDHPSLPGLIGPEHLGGSRFTLDYESGKMAVSVAPLPDAVEGFRPVPLVRSQRHPMLILVMGTIENRSVLLELDTGKSRTVVNPSLAAELGLDRNPRGVSIGKLGLGDLSFAVPSAKEVDQTGIDPTLPEQILAGVGSDILSRFVWTVDYKAGVLWIPISE